MQSSEYKRVALCASHLLSVLLGPVNTTQRYVKTKKRLACVKFYL